MQLSRDLLIRAFTYKLQERAYGSDGYQTPAPSRISSTTRAGLSKTVARTLEHADADPLGRGAVKPPPRTDFTGLQLCALAKQTKDAGFARRLLALSEIFDGGSRSDAARIGGVGLQTIRDWVLHFNAKGPEGLKDGKAPGQASLLKDEHRRALAQKIEDGPNPRVDG
jgi:hypothetical protein